MRLGLLLAVLCAPAWGWPVDVVQDLEAGKEKFIHLSSLDWFEVEDPKVVSVEYLESGEILFTPLKPGRTLVLMYAEKKFAVWRIRVGDKAAQPEGGTLLAALKACPKLEHHPEAYDKLSGAVEDEKCRQALLALLATDAFVGKDLSLTFEQPVLQAQLKAIEAEFKAQKLGIAARYEGVSLVLEGTLEGAGLRKAFWGIFRRSAGRVAMEDQLKLGEDAGLGEPAGKK
jgi:hypothetical protein